MPTNDEELAKGQPKADVSQKKSKSEVKSEIKTKVVAKSKTLAAVAADKPKAVSGAQDATKAQDAKGTEGAMKPVVSTSGRLGGMGWNADAKSATIKVAAVVLGLAVVVVAVFGVLIYGYKSENPAVKAVAAVVPYPVEKVNGSFVSYSDYLFEVDLNERGYQNNAKLNNQPAVDFTSADGKKLVTQFKQHSLQTLENYSLEAQLAHQRKVTVSDKDVNTLINQLYQKYGGKDTLLKLLNTTYGWNVDDLKKVIRWQLLEQNLSKSVTSDPAAAATAKAKAEDVLNKVKAGGDFATLAKQDSQASDAANGGDLGFFTKGQVPDEMFSAAQALQPGQVSDVIKDAYGYEILKVIEKKDDGSIHAQEILIKTIDFNSYLKDQLKKAKVNTYIKV